MSFQPFGTQKRSKESALRGWGFEEAPRLNRKRHLTGQAKIEMTETALCSTRFRDCSVEGLFLSFEHSRFEFVSARPGAT